MNKEELCAYLEKSGAILMGSRFLGLSNEKSDYDYFLDSVMVTEKLKMYLEYPCDHGTVSKVSSEEYGYIADEFDKRPDITIYTFNTYNVQLTVFNKSEQMEEQINRNDQLQQHLNRLSKDVLHSLVCRKYNGSVFDGKGSMFFNNVLQFFEERPWSYPSFKGFLDKKRKEYTHSELVMSSWAHEYGLPRCNDEYGSAGYDRHIDDSKYRYLEPIFELLWLHYHPELK